MYVAKCCVCLMCNKKIPAWCSEIDMPCLALKQELVLNTKEYNRFLSTLDGNLEVSVDDSHVDQQFVQRMKNGMAYATKDS